MRAEHLSCPEAANRFGVQSKTQVARWERIYLEEGTELFHLEKFDSVEQPGKDIRAWLCARAPCRKAREEALALWPGKAGGPRPGDCGPGPAARGGRRGAYLYRARCAAVRHPAGGACPDAFGPTEVCEAEAQCPSADQSARGGCAPAGGAGRLCGSSGSHRSSGAGRGRKRRKARSGRKEVLPQQAWIPL